MIIISPWSRKLRNGMPNNPKNYPWWNELIKLIKENFSEQKIIQIGQTGEDLIKGVDEVMFDKSLNDLKHLLKICDTFISVDNFFHHLASYIGKRGIVLFGPSDPNIFGDKNNVNLLKDRKYLRQNQFDFYENTKHNSEFFMKPYQIIPYLKEILKK